MPTGPPPIPYATPAAPPAGRATAAAAGPVMSPEAVTELRAAQDRMRRVRRAVSVATFDYWGIGIFGVLTFLSSLLFFSAIGIALGAGMTIVAYVEFRGAGRLRRLDPAACRVLAYNQLALGAMLFAYAAWMLYAAWSTPSPLAAELASAGLSGGDALSDTIGSLEGLTRTLSLTVYLTVMAVAVLVQGGTAVYYFTRAKHVRAYVDQTPAWVVQMQQNGVRV